MGTWPNYKKHFLQLILTKKNIFIWWNISSRLLFFSFLFNLYLYIIYISCEENIDCYYNLGFIIIRFILKMMYDWY